MKSYLGVFLSILMVIAGATSFGDEPNCKKTGKNCPMNDKKECNCGKECDCDKM